MPSHNGIMVGDTVRVRRPSWKFWQPKFRVGEVVHVYGYPIDAVVIEFIETKTFTTARLKKRTWENLDD